MGLGKRKDAVSFTPLVKFDARNGQMTRCDRVQENGDWVTKAVSITDDFEAVPDLPNVEAGWAAFASGSAPDFRMFPLGTDIGERPSDKHKEGFRLRLLLRNGAGAGVYELAWTATGVMERHRRAARRIPGWRHEASRQAARDRHRRGQAGDHRQRRQLRAGVRDHVMGVAPAGAGGAEGVNERHDRPDGRRARLAACFPP